MNLIPNATSPEFWQEVREKEAYAPIREELLEMWNANCTEPIMAQRYSDFRLFKYTGNRTTYEATYCVRRKGLCAAGMLALIYPEEEKYLIRLMDTVYAICDEYTWCLPAHNTALETNNNCHLDLFACETALYLAEIDTVFGDRLEGLIRSRIRAELERRVYKPWSEKIFGWERIDTNWNAVCTGCIACSMMLMRPESVEEYLPRIQNNMELYLSGFGDDGVCLEGVSYWHYGFGYFTIFAEYLRRFTEGKIDYFARPKIKAIATFMQNCYLTEGCTVSFADAQTKNKYQLGLFHFLKSEYSCAITVPDRQYSYNTDSRGRWPIFFRSLLWLKEEYLTPDETAETYTEYFPDAQWMIHRNKRFGFAAKGGHNNEPHNHNDVGSFILAANGRQVLTDMGAGQYTRQYFARDTRYGIIQCSSRGHSVPIVGGEHQKFGKDYKATDSKYENGVFSTDIAPAYGLDSLKSLIRSFEWTEDAVILRDSFKYEGDGALTERFVTLMPPIVIEDGRIDMRGGVMTYDPEKYTLAFSKEPRTEDKFAYFTDLTLKDGVTEFTATFTICR